MSDITKSVQMQYMRPSQVESAGKQLPVVYVPFGLIEWHGRHLPLGVDAIKAHAIAVRTAEQFGGVVYPPVYFHDGFDQDHLLPLLTELFERLRNMGFRVIIGISGHNTQGQLDMINGALQPVFETKRIKVNDTLHKPAKPNSVTGLGIWEISLSQGDDSQTDHAAKWETSDIMFFYPDLVNLKELGSEPLAPPDGIGGLDPREHASVEVGRRNVELASAAIGTKAKELLESLPEDQRGFNIEPIGPESWWLI